MNEWFHCVARQCLPPSGLHCTRHAVLHALDGVSPSPIQPRSIIKCLPCVWHLQETTEGFPDEEDHTGAVVATASHRVLCTESTLAVASIGHKTQHLWELLLMASTPMPRIIPKQVSFEQAL